METRLSLFPMIRPFLLPSVALVNGFGFCVWIYQLLTGPFGSPA